MVKILKTITALCSEKKYISKNSSYCSLNIYLLHTLRFIHKYETILSTNGKKNILTILVPTYYTIFKPSKKYIDICYGVRHDTLSNCF